MNVFVTHQLGVSNIHFVKCEGYLNKAWVVDQDGALVNTRDLLGFSLTRLRHKILLF